jgi:hypothetical protein
MLKIYLGYLILIELSNLIVSIKIGPKETLVEYVQIIDDWFYSQFGQHLTYSLNSQCVQRILKIVIICILISLL